MSGAQARYVTSLLGVVVATAALACGGESPSVSPTTSPTSAPTLSAATATPVAPAGQPTTADEAAFSWEIEDVGRGTKPALALSSDGTPNVAFMLEAMPGFVKNAVRTGATWDVTTVAEGYFYGPLDIAIGPDDTIHIAYHDHQDSTFKPDKGDAIYAVLATSGGSGWQVELVFNEGHDGWDNRIVTDAEGRPHMSALDPKEFDGDGVEYYRRDDAGKWLVENIGTGPLTYKYATAIAIDPDGKPHITYHDQEHKDLALASRDSGWSIQTVDSDGDTGLFSSFVIAPDGRFHVSYVTKTSITSGTVKYATKGPGDAGWQISEVDSLDNLTFGFVGARNVTSVAVDSTGNTWIAYSDEKTLKLGILDGSRWRTNVVVDAQDRTLGQLVSLKLDSGDRPHIAYFEVTDKVPLEVWSDMPREPQGNRGCVDSSHRGQRGGP